MIQLRIRAGQPKPWRAHGCGWTDGASDITPFSHPALESFALAAPQRLLIVVRERLAGAEAVGRPASEARIDAVDAITFVESYEAVRRWPLDYTAVHLDAGSPSIRAEITAGLWGSAPLYLVQRRDELWGHWDPTELYPHLGGERLFPEFAARFIVDCDPPYSRRTLFPNMYRLTERAQAFWSADADGDAGFRIEYPTAVAPPRPRVLRPDADPAGAFQDILSASTRRWFSVPPGARSAQLSGGLDSGIVAGTVARLSPEPVPTFGLVMPGAAGAGQQARREELIALFGCIDRSLEAAAYLPLSSRTAGRAGHPPLPWGEMFWEAFSALLGEARQSNRLVSLNGTGGDELCSPHWDEMSGERQARRRKAVFGVPDDLPSFLSPHACQAIRDTALTVDRAPVAPLFTSALDAASAVSPLFLKHGIWPVSPLCTPELVAFSRCLPREWRDHRRIQREVLTRLGCSRTITHPTAPEDFGPVLDLSIRQRSRPLLTQLFESPRLAEIGLVDAGRLQSAYARHCAARDGDNTPFYAAAVLELAVRSIDATSLT